MLRLHEIVGVASDPGVARVLHRLAHAGAVEYLTLEPQDSARHRIRMATDKGTDCAIAIPREQRLCDGAVLLLDDERAIVVRLTETQWLKFRPADLNSALELGQAAGNAHWRIRVEDEALCVAVEGAEDDYARRIETMVQAGRVRLKDD